MSVPLAHNALSTNIPSQLHKIKNLLSHLSVRACTHYIQALCFCFTHPFKKLTEKTQSQKKPLAVAIASYTLKKFAHKQLFTHSTNQHKTTCQGLASCHTGPHRILSCPKQTIWSQFTSGKIENSHQKLLKNSLIRLWTCTASKKTKIQTFAQVQYLRHFFI